MVCAKEYTPRSIWVQVRLAVARKAIVVFFFHSGTIWSSLFKFLHFTRRFGFLPLFFSREGLDVACLCKVSV